ncbi:MAG: hypothetical protein B7Z66_12845 [Chromatiales bacterium 21-64-14]|nr:MAG: hypothetical protein B7Z66_12845 [Chromatiales bacterium 21-64-14]HQU16348.1 lipid-A-disaccharide synthase N-terminal domain-containing protein [Gammaproteobacteria bacterium]
MNCQYHGVWLTEPHRVLGLDWSYLTLLGLVGAIAFSMRFILQWVHSERAGKSVIPVSFWYWSIGGSLIMLAYFIFQRDPVGVLAYLPNSAIYLRNLYLIRKDRQAGVA